jgi:hypothetical protein
MKRAIVITGVLAATFTAGCSSGTPAPSHADRLACRTIYRLQELFNASGGLPVVASNPPGQAAAALGASAIGTSQPLNKDMTAASQKLLLMNTPDTAQLAPMERDCTALGITASNAEDVS